MRNVMRSFYGLLLLQFVALNSLLVLAIRRSDNKENPVLTTPKLVSSHGYRVEIHNVITEDGYILEIHRLPCGRMDCERKSANVRRPILIQHGLASSSADWVLMGPGWSLAYMLVDAGYDVWLGNNRGNDYSRNHVELLPTDQRFWDFSYHELGVYDVPATIDYILNQTNFEKLVYIGHSQGCTQFFVGMSQHPEYNAKVKYMIALAPAAFTGNLRGPITRIVNFEPVAVKLGEAFGYPEIRPRSAWVKFVTSILCEDAMVPLFCKNIMFLISGFTQSNLSLANLTTIMNHVPAGASWKQFVHYGQGYIYQDRFRPYHYEDDEKNYRVYNASEPPDYELDKVTTPIAIFSSEVDLLASQTDINILKSRLNNVVFHKEITIKSFSHYDFLWGLSVVPNVFEPVVKLVALYD